jgi:hypothetical protein
MSQINVDSVPTAASALSEFAPPCGYYSIDVSNNYPLIDAIYCFMHIHPTMYKTNVGKKIINHKNKMYDIFDDKVHFHDTVHDVKGYMTVKYADDTLSMQVRIQNDRYEHKCYVKTLKKYVDHYSEFGNTVSLKFYKILPKRLVQYTFYDEPLDQWPADVSQLKSTFFSPHKNYLFDVTKPTDTHFTHAWNNIILHGPPGTGKSSFVHRMAIQRKMTIISLDLTMYLDKKTELYALFHGEPFTLPDSGEKCDVNKNYIIILDEFDTAINTLLAIEKIFEHRKQLTESYFKRQQQTITSTNAGTPRLPREAAWDTASTSPAINGRDHTRERTRSRQSTREFDLADGEEFNSQSFLLNALNTETLETKNNRYQGVPPTPREMYHTNMTNKAQFDTNINMINSNIKTLINSINEENKSDMVHMSELLELFQGAVPVKKRMIIATTNNFEPIKKAIPALFRPGRLTPLEFNYIDWDSFRELCFYHYKRSPTTEFKITIPTSEIIELTNKYADLDLFVEYIKKKSTAPAPATVTCGVV